jgi:S-adenosylmethionine hydrolase
MFDKQIITLLSDFGLKDPYVSEMKAVLLSICPEVTIIDISHEIKKFEAREREEEKEAKSKRGTGS